MDDYYDCHYSLQAESSGWLFNWPLAGEAPRQGILWLVIYVYLCATEQLTERTCSIDICSNVIKNKSRARTSISLYLLWTPVKQVSCSTFSCTALSSLPWPILLYLVHKEVSQIYFTIALKIVHKFPPNLEHRVSNSLNAKQQGINYPLRLTRLRTLAYLVNLWKSKLWH